MPHTLLELALALAVGLIIGMERGWQQRNAAEGSRVAGVRTFGLISILGGLSELLSRGQSPLLFSVSFLAFALAAAIAHATQAMADNDYGITTLIAALIAFVLGALTVSGQYAVAAASAVVVAGLLSIKPVLHVWLQRIEPAEFRAALTLLLISVVVLPALPDEGYGPLQALNPLEIWRLVVLVAAISFAAYVAVKVAGAQRGVLLTGLLGGLVSSTSVTLNFARMARETERHTLLAAGVLVASATMFLRILVVVTILNPSVVAKLVLPFVVMSLPLFLAAAYWAWHENLSPGAELRLSNPVELRHALKFGALLALTLLLTKVLQEWWGVSGLYLLAAVAGIADVDAITLSAARMKTADAAIASHAIAIAALTNTLTKGLLAWTFGGKKFGFAVLTPVAIALACGGIVLLSF